MTEQEQDTQDTTVDLQSLYSKAIDHQKSQKDTVALLDEPGTYHSVPEMSITVKSNESGRITVAVAGKGISPKTGGTAYIRAYLSPDAVYKDDGKTPDFKYARWLEAVSAYRGTFGSLPDSEGLVVEYLQKYAAAFTIKRIGVPTKDNPEPDGEPGTMVTRIGAVKG